MNAQVGPADARRMWQLFEPVHAVVYFAPQARAAFETAGLRGFWRGYFAGRVAAMGAAGPEVVTAVCHGFAPAHVERAVPDVWSRVSPAQALAARADGARASLQAALADAPATGRPTDLAEAADLIGVAAGAVDTGGRALAAATAAVPRPRDPLDAIWHSATVLREHRGDGHVAALVAEGVTGLQALVLRAGADLDRALLQPARGWTDAQWDAAVAVLAERGLVTAPLDRDGVTTTTTGLDLLERVEAVTDRLAAEAWRALGRDGTERLATLIGPLSAAARGVLPALTPIGLPPAPS